MTNSITYKEHTILISDIGDLLTGRIISHDTGAFLDEEPYCYPKDDEYSIGAFSLYMTKIIDAALKGDIDISNTKRILLASGGSGELVHRSDETGLATLYTRKRMPSIVYYDEDRDITWHYISCHKPKTNTPLVWIYIEVPILDLDDVIELEDKNVYKVQFKELISRDKNPKIPSSWRYYLSNYNMKLSRLTGSASVRKILNDDIIDMQNKAVSVRMPLYIYEVLNLVDVAGDDTTSKNIVNALKYAIQQYFNR